MNTLDQPDDIVAAQSFPGLKTALESTSNGHSIWQRLTGLIGSTRKKLFGGKKNIDQLPDDQFDEIAEALIKAGFSQFNSLREIRNYISISRHGKAKKGEHITIISNGCSNSASKLAIVVDTDNSEAQKEEPHREVNQILEKLGYQIRLIPLPNTTIYRYQIVPI